MCKIRVVAINLPQFHPFKENDEWWGKGFTEWTNVTKAKPRFNGHFQPHLPTETGFYDLRLPEARTMQADMAREAGIYGFCYYHYWFNGHQLMDRPVNDILSSGEPDFPFMLCWANENWARNWDGGFQNVLIEQNYSEEDDIEHMRWLCRNVFCDRRYIRVDEKPVFIVYRTEFIPSVADMLSTWRRIAKEEFGLELYLMKADFPDSNYGKNPVFEGFDAAFDFQPIAVDKYISPQKSKIESLFYSIPKLRGIPFLRNYFDKQPTFFDYETYINTLLKRDYKGYKIYPCVSPGFDNSPRRVNRKFMCIRDGNPTLFGRWLFKTMHQFRPFSKDENFVFVNAWNEWAEGNHLEPDNKWGRAYLDETKKAINGL